MRRRSSRTVDDAAQLELFDLGLPTEDEAIRAYYRRLRRAAITLRLDLDTGQIIAQRDRVGAPGWWAAPARRYYHRIRADLLRVEHSIEPEIAREDLDGGATLVRLPERHRDIAMDPPVAHRAPSRTPRRGGAA